MSFSKNCKSLQRIAIVRRAWRTSEAEGRKKAGEYALLSLDLLALLSFVPWSQTSENARILRLVRLTRLLLLVKYWGSLVRDIWTVLVRRERARQILLMGFAVAILSFCGAVVLQTIGSSGADINADGQAALRRKFRIASLVGIPAGAGSGNMIQSLGPPFFS